MTTEIKNLLQAQNEYRQGLADNLDELMAALNEHGIVDMDANIKAFQCDLRKEVHYDYDY